MFAATRTPVSAGVGFGAPKPGVTVGAAKPFGAAAGGGAFGGSEQNHSRLHQREDWQRTWPDLTLMQASVGQTMLDINAACKARGGAHAGCSCETVSWDDAARGTVVGGLSSHGAPTSQTRKFYLKAKDGQGLRTVRPDNWNEKLGRGPRPPRSRSSRATRPRAARPWRRSRSATS